MNKILFSEYFIFFIQLTLFCDIFFKFSKISVDKTQFSRYNKLNKNKTDKTYRKEGTDHQHRKS